MVSNGSEMIRYNPSTSAIEYSNSKGFHGLCVVGAQTWERYVH